MALDDVLQIKCGARRLLRFMYHLMEFVSSITMVNEKEEFREDVESGLCKIRIKEDAVSETMDEVEISKLKVDSLLVSEGTEIFSKTGLGIDDVRVFIGENIDEESKKYVWYELLKMLTGHKVYVASLDNKITFSKWTCRMQDDKVWRVVMELESSAIIRKIAEFDLCPVKNGEADLFEMADKLYQDICSVNDSYRNMKESDLRNRSRVKELVQERELLDKLLEERDNKTRAIVVTLLNEKKKKIRELNETLRRNNIKVCGDDIPDSGLINMEVAKPISELNSPGKRLKRRRVVESQNLNKKLENANRRKSEKKAQSNSPIKKEDDDFDDFQFFGISKRSSSAKNDKLSEKEDDSISFGNDTKSIGSLSDNTDDDDQEHLVSLDENNNQSSAVKPIKEHDNVPGSGSESETETDSSTEKVRDLNHDKHNNNGNETNSGSEQETDIETDES